MGLGITLWLFNNSNITNIFSSNEDKYFELNNLEWIEKFFFDN